MPSPSGLETGIPQNRIAQVLFYIDKKSQMVVPQGFIKKTQRTLNEDLELARRNKARHQG
jgi:hypothetical protein